MQKTNDQMRRWFLSCVRRKEYHELAEPKSGEQPIKLINGGTLLWWIDGNLVGKWLPLALSYVRCNLIADWLIESNKNKALDCRWN